MMRVRTPASAQPATSPACVPPDDDAWTMTSGGWHLLDQLGKGVDEGGGAERRRRAERDDVGVPADGALLLGNGFHHRRALSRRAARSECPRRATDRAARLRSGGPAAAPLATSTHRRPSLAAAAAVTRAWLDCTPPHVMSVSACARARRRRRAASCGPCCRRTQTRSRRRA